MKDETKDILQQILSGSHPHFGQSEANDCLLLDEKYQTIQDANDCLTEQNRQLKEALKTKSNECDAMKMAFETQSDKLKAILEIG